MKKIISLILVFMLFSTLISAEQDIDEKYNGRFIVKDPLLQEKVKNLKVEPNLIQDMNKLFSDEKYNGKSYEQYIRENSEKYKVEEALIKAIITQESAGNPNAGSSAGAQGLMQLMPETAIEACSLPESQIKDPDKNIECGTRYIKKQIDDFKQLDLALAAYNAGPGAVQPRLSETPKVPNIPETQNYVVRVLRYYIEFGGSGSVSSLKNIPSGNLKYSIKSAIRTGLNYDFSDYARANEIAQKKKKQILECLKAGSGTSGDDDVKECSSLASDSETHTSGVDKKGEFVIIFEKALNFQRKYTEPKDKRIKFGYLIKDDIPPPATSIVQVLSEDVNKGSNKDGNKDTNKNSIFSPVWSPNFASDVAKLEIYCSLDGGSSWITVNSGANAKLLNLNNIAECGPIVKGKIYCLKVIAVDEAGNKQDSNSAVNCEQAK